MGFIHRVSQGECLSSIAKQYGFSDWHTIYDHGQNASFKQKRQNPNILHPGDELFIPERELKEVSAATGKRHPFQVKRPKQTLRIALAKVEIPDQGDAADPQQGRAIQRKRIAGAPYLLVVDGTKEYSGSTDGDGLLSVEIPVDAKTGRLTVNNHVWDLQIAYLNPVEGEIVDNGVSGAQARLKNLGYYEGPFDGVVGQATEEALRWFQADHLLEVTGQLDAATRAKLAEIHGC